MRDGPEPSLLTSPFPAVTPLALPQRSSLFSGIFEPGLATKGSWCSRTDHHSQSCYTTDYLAPQGQCDVPEPHWGHGKYFLKDLRVIYIDQSINHSSIPNDRLPESSSQLSTAPQAPAPHSHHQMCSYKRLLLVLGLFGNCRCCQTFTFNVRRITLPLVEEGGAGGAGEWASPSAAQSLRAPSLLQMCLAPFVSQQTQTLKHGGPCRLQSTSRATRGPACRAHVCNSEVTPGLTSPHSALLAAESPSHLGLWNLLLPVGQKTFLEWFG